MMALAIFRNLLGACADSGRVRAAHSKSGRPGHSSLMASVNCRLRFLGVQHFCAKYREMSSSGIFRRGSHVCSVYPYHFTRNSSVPSDVMPCSSNLSTTYVGPSVFLSVSSLVGANASGGDAFSGGVAYVMRCALIRSTSWFRCG